MLDPCSLSAKTFTPTLTGVEHYPGGVSLDLISSGSVFNVLQGLRVSFEDTERFGTNSVDAFAMCGAATYSVTESYPAGFANVAEGSGMLTSSSNFDTVTSTPTIVGVYFLL